MTAPAPALTADAEAAGPIQGSTRGGSPRLALSLLRNPLLITLAGGWLIGDVLHLPLTAVLGLAAGVGCWTWLAHRQRPLQTALPDSPTELVNRCRELLEQFAELSPGEGEEGHDIQGLELRRHELEQLDQRLGRRGLELALLGTAPPPQELQAPLLAALQGSLPLRLHWAHPLPRRSTDWRWPEAFQACDGLLFHLRPPLQACDLRWLQAIPHQQAAWLLVQSKDPAASEAATSEAPLAAANLLEELRSQLPAGLGQQLIVWDGAADSLGAALSGLRSSLQHEGSQTLRATDRRLLEQLHRRWQGELELLRRGRFQQLQQRTQWIVAAGVFAAPLASLDLLVLAVANGLMLQEMARLWRCPWGPAQLREAALALAQAALGLGLAEWSSRSLTAVLRLHGATWLVGGALQALSAAYLTRVVGAAMADVLALSVGVDAPDLEAIRRRAPELVAAAAERERLDWSGFLEQGRRWLRSQPAAAGLEL